MEFQEYAEQLNHFSFLFSKEDSDIFSIDEDVRQRIVLSRLYYALLHHFFELHKELALSSGAGKHETMLRVVQKEHQQSSDLFFTLKRLREWADYHPQQMAPFPLNVGRLLHNTNRVIQQKL